MFNGKNIDFDEWIAEIEKVSNLTGKPEYILALAKSSGTPYKIISQTPSNTVSNKLKRKLQEVYSLVATDVHMATDLLRKQCTDELLQDYIAYWIEICHQRMNHNPTTTDNKLMIILFIKNLYNKDIRQRVAGVKNFNTLLDAFKTAQWNLLKLKKYEGLVSEDDSIHSIHTANQISDISKSSGHFSQPGNVNLAMPPVKDGQSNLTIP